MHFLEQAEMRLDLCTCLSESKVQRPHAAGMPPLGMQIQTTYHVTFPRVYPLLRVDLSRQVA